jgi:hypothetical protein
VLGFAVAARLAVLGFAVVAELAVAVAGCERLEFHQLAEFLVRKRHERGSSLTKRPSPRM